MLFAARSVEYVFIEFNIFVYVLILQLSRGFIKIIRSILNYHYHYQIRSIIKLLLQIKLSHQIYPKLPLITYIPLRNLNTEGIKFVETNRFDKRNYHLLSVNTNTKQLFLELYNYLQMKGYKMGTIWAPSYATTSLRTSSKEN